MSVFVSFSHIVFSVEGITILTRAVCEALQICAMCQAV